MVASFYFMNPVTYILPDNTEISLPKLLMIGELFQDFEGVWSFIYQAELLFCNNVKKYIFFSPNKDEVVMGVHCDYKKPRPFSVTMANGFQVHSEIGGYGNCAHPTGFNIKDTLYYKRINEEIDKLRKAWREAIGEEVMELNNLIAKIII